MISGAQAADAVVAAEPEPMEYVRVCDAYGTGFFYIPGTETCLKFWGQLRYEKRWTENGAELETLRRNGTVRSRVVDAYDHHSRFRLDIEARNDTEWGTAYSWIRLQGDQFNNGEDIDGSGRNSFTSFYYYFGIGGLEFGNYDSLWAKFMGDGGRTDDAGIYTTDFNYPDSRQYASYTHDFGAIKAFVSLDNDADEYYGTGTTIYVDADGDGIEEPGEAIVVSTPGEQHGNGTPRRGRLYMPDVSAGFMGAWGIYQGGAAVAYDESDESFAFKKVFKADWDKYGVSLYGLYSESSENIYFAYDGFSVLASFSAQVTESVYVAKDIQWFDNGDWRIVGDVHWDVASGFSVLAEGIYFNPDKGSDTKSGFLRFQREF
jgi:hypothetical protein